MKVDLALPDASLQAILHADCQVASLPHTRILTGNEADVSALSGPFPADGSVKAKLANRV